MEEYAPIPDSYPAMAAKVRAFLKRINVRCLRVFAAEFLFGFLVVAIPFFAPWFNTNAAGLTGYDQTRAMFPRASGADLEIIIFFEYLLFSWMVAFLYLITPFYKKFHRRNVWQILLTFLAFSLGVFLLFGLFLLMVAYAFSHMSPSF